MNCIHLFAIGLTWQLLAEGITARRHYKTQQRPSPCQIPTVANGDVINLRQDGAILAAGTYVQSGTVIGLLCRSGFQISRGGLDRTTCRDDGTYEQVIGCCRPVESSSAFSSAASLAGYSPSHSCGIPVIPNGYLTQLEDSNAEDSSRVLDAGTLLQPGQGVVLHCNGGSSSDLSATTDERPIVSTKSICTLSSRWIPAINKTACMKPVITCNSTNFPTLENGRYIEDISKDCYPVGTTRMLMCNNGFQLSNGATKVITQCLSTGVWSSLECNCQDGKKPTQKPSLPPPKTCNASSLPKLENGNVIYDYYDEDITNNTFEVGATFEFECQPGFVPTVGSSSAITTTCLAPAGQWSPISASCKAATLKCRLSSLPNLANGSFQNKPTTSEVPTGTSLGLLCDSGFTFSGSLTSITCQPNGTWSTMNGICSAVSTISLTGQAWLDSQILAAAQNGSVDSVGRLLDQGANVETKNGNGYTPLLVATANNRLECVRFLLGRGAEIEARSIKGWTALMVAAHNGYLTVVKALVDQGANLETKTLSHKNSLPSHSAVMLAAHENKRDVVQFLIEKGASTQDCHYALC